ncbi:Adaptor for signal transduction [Mortierella sp. AM989]|nr:Adaptor for signal transduction [Mortierella sp. AM989]
MALSIIQAQYHIYHTDLSGYLAGGAMVQDALTKYALGGTSKDLHQTYKRFKQDAERIPPAPTITITTRNWRDWLGHKSYYHDYLDFFDHELSQLEERTLEESSSSTCTEPLSTSWSASHSSPLTESMAKMVSDYLTPLIPGLCASTGALIHLGYGVEFGSRLLIAEGLAYACISYQSATTCFIPTDASDATPSWEATISTESSTPQKRSPSVSILNMIRNDKRLDGIFDAGFQAKLNVVMSSRVSLLKSYLGMWTSQVHSVSEALLDLSQTSGLLLFTATNRFGDEQQLDKNLANILLATHAARFLVKVLPSELEKEQLLKAVWMSLVATFVVQGRPRLTNSMSSTMSTTSDAYPQEKEHESTGIDSEGNEQRSSTKFGMTTLFSEPETMSSSGDRWKSLSFEAIHADHQIVPKIVRSLLWAELEHGECNDLFYEIAVRSVGEDPASDESSGPDNAISGDLLIHLDHAALKDLSIWEVGKRLVILKAIYQLKVSYGISLEAGDFVPPSVAFENEYNYQAAASLKSVEQAMHEKDNTIQHLVREVERMSKDLSKVKDELWVMQKDQKPLPEPSPGYPKTVNGQSSSMLSAAQTTHTGNSALTPQSPIHASHGLNTARSPVYSTDSGFHSVPSSPHSPADVRIRTINVDANEDSKAGSSPSVDGAGAIKVYGQKPSNTTRDPVDAFRSFRISQDDPCYKVLPAALKKYKINDDWRQYALFICYGNTERILTYNEKPLLLMKQLKENNESPVFMLKHIKQMKSPAVNAPSPPNSFPPRKSTDLMNKELPMPPEFVAGATLTSGATLGSTNGNANSSLHRSGTSASMRTSSKTASSTSASTTPTTLGSFSMPTIPPSAATLSNMNPRSEASSTLSSSTIVGPKPENYVQETVEASGTAVALYAWEAKRDDELTVKVGDVFKIKSKGHGWWVVQRDDQIGWIPASILSESNSEDGYFSAEGVAIFDFAKTGPNELSIKTGDKLVSII